MGPRQHALVLQPPDNDAGRDPYLRRKLLDSDLAESAGSTTSLPARYKPAKLPGWNQDFGRKAVGFSLLPVVILCTFQKNSAFSV